MSWFESEDFWTNYGPIMFDDNRWAEAPDVAAYIKKIAGLKEGDTVLDAGCGLGRISVELAALGMDVTGVDIIQNELDAAAESAEAEGVELRLVNTDLRTFKLGKGQPCEGAAGIPEKPFDCAISCFTSFGYCDTVKEDLTILKNIADGIREGGTFVLECLSRETAILYFTEGEKFDRAGMHVTTKFEVTGMWEGLRSTWILDDDEGHHLEHSFVQRLYSAPELCRQMIECGFSEAKAYGDFDLSPYNQNARTMVIVAKK